MPTLEQLVVQRDVLLEKIKDAALDIEQTFSRLISQYLREKKIDLGREKYGEQMRVIRGVVAFFKNSKDAMQLFEQTMMSEQPHVCYWAEDCANVIQRMFLFHRKHVKELAFSTHFWRRVFIIMLRTIYIHPQIYTVLKSHELAQSIELIERSLYRLILSFVETRDHDEHRSGLTKEKLDRMTNRHDRRATSRVSSLRYGGAAEDPRDSKTLVTESLLTVRVPE